MNKSKLCRARRSYYMVLSTPVSFSLRVDFITWPTNISRLSLDGAHECIAKGNRFCQPASPTSPDRIQWNSSVPNAKIYIILRAKDMPIWMALFFRRLFPTYCFKLIQNWCPQNPLHPMFLASMALKSINLLWIGLKPPKKRKTQATTPTIILQPETMPKGRRINQKLLEKTSWLVAHKL